MAKPTVRWRHVETLDSLGDRWLANGKEILERAKKHPNRKQENVEKRIMHVAGIKGAK